MAEGVAKYRNEDLSGVMTKGLPHALGSFAVMASQVATWRHQNVPIRPARRGFEELSDHFHPLLSVTESELRKSLLMVVASFNDHDHSVAFDYILQPLEAREGEPNWAVAATASTPWKAVRLAECQLALEECRKALPNVFWQTLDTELI